MMRAVRIAAKLGFTIEPATEAPIPKMAKLSKTCPPPVWSTRCSSF